LSLFHSAVAAGLAVAVFVSGAAGVLAAPATAASNVNVRSGPGQGYAVVDFLKRGEQVDVFGCQGTWCQVESRWVEGWVSSDFLILEGGRPGSFENPIPVDSEPRFRHQPSHRPRHHGGPGYYDNDWGW
jgi:uncharacterized protein YraI